MNTLPVQIKRNTLLIISFLVLVSWGVGYKFLEYQQRNSVNEQFKGISESTHKLFMLNLEEERKISEYKLTKIISKDGLSKAISDKNYKAIDSIVKPLYERLRLVGRSIDILTFRSPEGITLYRAHKREFFGDTLNKKRKLIIDTNTFQRSFSGFEVGKLKVTYRITKPIFYKNKYVGNVELGISPAKFIKELNSIFKVEMGIAIDKSLVGVMLEKVVKPEDHKYILVAGDDNIKTHFYHKHEKDKETYKTDMNISLKNHLDEPFGYFVVGYDISDILKENKEFMHRIFAMTALMTLIIGFILHLSFNKVLGQFTKQAYTDHLTGLENRQALNDLLHSKKSNLLILSNIKDFSLLNELYGIKTGNKILEEVAKAFKEFSQEYNFSAYRISSDEYVLVKLEDNFDVDECSQTIKKLQEMINALLIKIDGDIIGVEIYSGVSVGFEHSLAEAQMALKKAREKSLPFLTYSKQVDTKLHSQSIIEVKKTVRYALNHKNIVPFFQPITDRNGKTIKYEALVRILKYSESGKTILTPDKFLDISMKSVLYIQIANKMLEQSLAFFANREEKISVNFLPNDFFDKSIMDTLMKGIENFDSPDRIVVEITEQEGVEDFSRLLDVVKKLKDIGVQIAIDDFGSGYANYAHILRIRPDYLKIDGSLVKNILTNDESKILVKSIIRFAKELNITTVAEYVESEDIFELLKEYGVDEYQGYYFGKPANLLNR